MCVLSLKERRAIVHHYERCKSIAATARACKCSRKTVYRWLQRSGASKDVISKPKSGRRHVMSSKVAKRALQLLKGGRFSGAKAVAVHMKDSGYLPRVVSKATMISHCRKEAKRQNDKLVLQRGRPPKGMTQETMDRRLEFALKHQKTKWDNVMFSDRKRFYFRFPGSVVRPTRWQLQSEMRGAHSGVYQPTHPGGLNSYVGITRHGVTKVHVVAGTTRYKHCHRNMSGEKAKSITSLQYKEVVHKTFLKGGKHLFKDKAWVLQQDNDPTHRVAHEVIEKWNRQGSPKVRLLLGWPPSSPDLNLIENFWAYIEQRVSQVKCHTFQQFVRCVKAEVKSTSPTRLDYLGKLYDSMPKRLAKVIENQGGKSGY